MTGRGEPPGARAPRRTDWWGPSAAGTLLVTALLAGTAASNRLHSLVGDAVGERPPGTTDEWGPLVLGYLVLLGAFSTAALGLVGAAWWVARSGGWVASWVCASIAVVLAALVFAGAG